ncbi:hypothetical protein LOD99_1510 [Oopsacas minuta]|uniref:Uncharacterized protein n=1 Tax=Oopsacas minuta TaxID=111878 RepID=A0AAV7K4Q7_9METZ|nr:hypothetical protein LOD99_1499 [Oopsacas minuta]KAI6656177.1 hypothetical protein LOD99_1510 [Oopsacas minuta]
MRKPKPSKKSLYFVNHLYKQQRPPIFLKFQSFFAMQNFDWKKKLGSLCTDGAPAMLGNKLGFAALVKKKAPNVTVTHCFLHQHALADIFGHMNEVNLSIQGPEVYIMDVAERLQALLDKLGLWKRRLEGGNYVNFSMLEEVLLHDGVERNKPLSASLQIEMCEHLDTLQNSFTGYFSSRDLKVEIWIRNHFSTDVNSIDDSDLAKDDIIDLRTKEMLHCEFNSKSLGESWCSLTQVYPRLAKRAMKALIPFATTYLCESGFSGLVNIKT